MKKLLLPLSFLIAMMSLSSCVKSIDEVDQENGQSQVTEQTEENNEEDTSEDTEPTQEETSEESEEETTTKATNESKEDSKAVKLLSEMSLHEKICQMFVSAPDDFYGESNFTFVDEWFASNYDAYPIGGFVMFETNIESEDQIGTLIHDMQTVADSKGVGLFVGVDEEGGSVSRLHYQLGTDYVSEMEYFGMLNDYDSAFWAGETIGSELARFGFNLDFAPVADVNISEANELGNRIFSSDSKIVSDMTSAFVDGLHSQSICSTLKHFPGLGAGDGNTHYGSVYIERTIEELRETEFEAFKGGIEEGSEFVMVGHQIVSASGEEVPSDLSKTVVTDWLKGELGFQGLVITDSHSMAAITDNYSPDEAAIMAIEAGVDIVLMPVDLKTAIDGVEQAVADGRISEERINESVLKILQIKEELKLLSNKQEETVEEPTEETTEPSTSEEDIIPSDTSIPEDGVPANPETTRTTPEPQPYNQTETTADDTTPNENAETPTETPVETPAETTYADNNYVDNGYVDNGYYDDSYNYNYDYNYTDPNTYYDYNYTDPNTYYDYNYSDPNTYYDPNYYYGY